MNREQRLAQRAVQGDRRAFAEIYDRYHQDLYRFCLTMVGNPQDAQDALQNTMLKVLRALPGEKREINLKPWLYRIARNESVEALRRRHNSAELAPQQASEVEVAATAETRERLRILLADLEQLPERQRAALVMRELCGFDFAQIGATFGTSPAVARQTLYEARRSLRQLEEGREMRCTEVMRELSDADGRVTRRRQIRAHLESCADCRAFREEIAGRRENLAGIAPLPVATSAGLLQSVLAVKAGSGGGATGAGLAGPLGAGAGKVAATSAIVKSVATVVVVAAVGVSAADRGKLIDLPLHSAGDGAAMQDATGTHSAGGGAANASADTRGPGAGRRGDREKSNPKANTDAGREAGHDHLSSSGSRSDSGQSPPGGGYGRSASERDGNPEQLPAAAAHGQQTAASHKPPHTPATSAPAAGGASPPHRGHAPANPGPPASTPGSPSEPVAPAPPPPPVEHPSGEGGPPAQAEDAPSSPGK